MNIRIVAIKCQELIRNNKWKSDNFHTSTEHCIDMCNAIINEDLEYSKGHRWLGWLQACMCINEVATLEELKQMNSES